MRTTKVKRLWPVMALALVFALAAVVGVGLWHSGPTPGWLTPPAAEAQGRLPDAIADATNIAYGVACNVADHGTDYTCITGGDSLVVNFTESDTGEDENVVVYVTGAGSTNDPQAVALFPNIQANDGEATPTNFGKRGVAEYGFDATGGLSDNITVRRSYADQHGDVYLIVEVDENSLLGETANELPGNADATDSIVRVHFTQPIDLDYNRTIRGFGKTGSPQQELPGRAEQTPTPRRVEVAVAETEELDQRRATDEEGTVGFLIVPRSKSSKTPPEVIHIGGRIEVHSEFTPGSAVKSGVAMERTDTVPGTSMDPTGASLVEADWKRFENVTVTGWEDEGAMELKVTFTHIALDGMRTEMDPLWLFRAGPAAAIEFAGDQAEPTDPHRVTSGTEYSTFGQLDILDALRQDATGVTHVIYEGADAAAVAILPEDEEDRMIPVAEATAEAGFSIDIESDAPSGTYDVNFVVKDADGMVLARLSVDIEVIGAPDAMDGAVRENVVNPGGMLELQNVALNSGSQSAYATPCSTTRIASGATHSDTTSICEWSGKTAEDRAVLTGGQGKVLTNGTQSIMVKADAAPGTYTIVLSDGRTGTNAAGMVADKEVTFMVRGRPARYMLDGPTVDGAASSRISSGQIGSFTVSAMDANGNAPYFPEGESADEVFVVVSGDASAVRLLRVTDGKVTLNARGEASFQVLVNDNAPSGSIRVTAVGLGDAVASKMVTIGPEMLGAPVLQRPTSPNDDTGTVNLSWTAGANSTQHWVAGIKKSDLDAGNVSVGTNGTVLWEAASSQTGHTFMGLDAGEVYLFTVTAGNAANEWSAWAPVQEVTVGRPAPTGGSGPGIPFGGN